MATGLNVEPNYKGIVDEYSEPIVVFDEELRVIYSNQRYDLTFGRAARHLSDIICETKIPDRELMALVIENHGSWQEAVSEHFHRAVNYTIKLVAMGGTRSTRFIGLFNKEKPKLLRNSADRNLIDSLTELPNRYAFMEMVENRIQQLDRHNDFAVLYIDLDHFKDINELYGHDTGDMWLKLCAENIRNMLRSDDVLARFSGDEFAAMVDCRETHEMQYLCHRLMRFFDRPIIMNGSRYQFTLSIGVAFFPEQGDQPQSLIINAEKAMFTAKKQGRAQFQLFDRKQSQAMEMQQRLAEAMRYVLSTDPSQFSAAYQPLYRIQDGKFLGVEVLARWHSLEFGEVSPVEFIGLAESRGLINELSACIFGSVERDILSTLPNTRPARPVIAVNVSAQQVGDADFDKLLKPFFQKVESAGWQLELELTESQLMTLSNKLVHQLEQWREMGIRVSIDDFGTGYSCLAYLHSLPVDKLKIDRQFLQTQTDTRKEDQIIYAIMSMANALGIEVLAEGIETKEQFRRMQELGCKSGQGFGLAKPSAWHPRLMRSLDL